jgi:hypothetical protein
MAPFFATTIELGLFLYAGVVMTAVKLLAALNTCDHAIKGGPFNGQIGYKVQTHAI